MPFRALRSLPRTILALLLIAGLALNLATLTVSSVFMAASGALSAVGISTVAAREASEAKLRREAAEKAAREASEKAAREAAERRLVVRGIARSTREGLNDRLQRQVARNVTSVFGEAVPVLGISVIAAALALEVKDSCDTAQDMTALAAAIDAEGDPEEARLAAVENFECADLIPQADDLPSRDDILGAIRTAPRQSWEAAKARYDSLAETDWTQVSSDIGESAGAMSDWFWSWFPAEEDVE